MSDETREYDFVVIGSGQGGKPIARDLAGAGRRTLLVERGPVGGTCVNLGCTPTKTMVASARVAYLARRAADYGVRTGPVSVDLPVVLRRKQEIVDSFRDGSTRRLETTANLDLAFGDATLLGADAVEVRRHVGGPLRVRAGGIVLNVGNRPLRPRVEGIDSVPVLDSTSIQEVDSLPEHLIVLGGGYIGLEFGQMFRRFGSLVTIVQRRAQLLTREDPDIAQEVASVLSDDGIEILVESEPMRLRETEEGGIEVTVRGPKGERSLRGSHVLAATGREPATEGLGLEAAGVESDGRGYVRVNQRLETTAKGVWAIGDVKGGPAFTHIAYDDYRVLKTNLLDGGSATTEGRLVPYTVFIDPQLGRVGMTEAEAKAAGRPYRVARLPMTGVARAIETGETRGVMKAIVDARNDRILGAAVLGLEGGEVMSVIQTAMMGGLPYTRIRDAAYAHPTLSESLNNLFMALD